VSALADGYANQYFCPVTRASEVIATRWTPIIIRNLLLGASTFSELQEGAPGIPRSLLTERLKQLELAKVIERHPKPNGRGWTYELTQTGRDLEPVVHALGGWGQKWIEANPLKPDPGVTLWAICKSMDSERLPEDRITVRVIFRDSRKRRFWLLVQKPEAEVCLKPPGYDEDLIVTSDTESLARFHMGELQLGTAMRAGRIQIEGPRHLIREFAGWGGVSPFAAVRPAYATTAA
jgi:DNA-binding HxlR family transcriptional regulator